MFGFLFWFFHVDFFHHSILDPLPPHVPYLRMTILPCVLTGGWLEEEIRQIVPRVPQTTQSAKRLK